MASPHPTCPSRQKKRCLKCKPSTVTTGLWFWLSTFHNQPQMRRSASQHLYNWPKRKSRWRVNSSPVLHPLPHWLTPRDLCTHSQQDPKPRAIPSESSGCCLPTAASLCTSQAAQFPLPMSDEQTSRHSPRRCSILGLRQAQQVLLFGRGDLLGPGQRSPCSTGTTRLFPPHLSTPVLNLPDLRATGERGTCPPSHPILPVERRGLSPASKAHLCCKSPLPPATLPHSFLICGWFILP